MPDGPDPKYWRYDAIVRQFAAWEREHPDVFTREIIGHTRRGEAIWAGRIGRAAGDPEPPPTLVLSAAQHANEANGTGALMRLAESLLAGEGASPSTIALVSGLDIWLVPVVNVDGHRVVFEGGPGWREWRKKVRDNDGDGAFSPARDGVDLHRNWDHRFGADPSVDPASRNYKGPRAFSEPETAALRDLISRTRPIIVVDVHSPGKVTPPNKVFWPWLERETGRVGPDAPAYRPIAQALAAATETEVDGVPMDGDGYGYDTLPKEQNWVYRETGACALLVEVSSRFWWEGPIVDVIAERVARGSMVLLTRALRGPGLVVHVTDVGTGAPLAAEIRVEEMHDPGIGPRMADPRTGVFRRLLPPGPVTVSVRADGYVTETRRVEIAAKGWSRIDARLRW